MTETTLRMTTPPLPLPRKRKGKLEQTFLLCAIVFGWVCVLGPWYNSTVPQQQPQPHYPHFLPSFSVPATTTTTKSAINTANRPSPQRQQLDRRQDVFGACLMFKDDVASLPEFLAYHYTVLPLRFVVLGTDVGNQQDPRPLLEKWSQRTALQYHLIPVGNLTDDVTLHQKHSTARDAHHAFVNRQRLFLRACIRQMKTWNVHWTTFTDSDEYVTYIYDQDYQPDTTLAQRLHKWQAGGELINQVCYTMPRLRYGSLETVQCPATTNSTREQHDTISFSSSLNTQRFVQHAHPYDFKANKYGKVLMNVSAIARDVVEKEKEPFIYSIHRPYTEYCARAAWVKEARLRVNHYTGSLDKFLGRADDVRRNADIYQQLSTYNHNHSCSDRNMRTWVDRFVEQISMDTAKELLGI
eukprot:scaffold2919_cov161-Amphora_coffeaeformis.AAC.4